MINIVHPLLTLLASLTRQELAQQIRFLKAENEILRSKLPKRVPLDDRERQTLVKHSLQPGERADTWHKFLKRNAETLWLYDFACKKKWTLNG